MKLVVKQHRPVRKFLAISLTVIVLVICGWLLVDYDQWQYIYARMTNNVEQRELLKATLHTDKESQSLRGQLLIAQRSSEIDHLAFKEAGKIIGQLQEEILDLKQELAFFHQLMGNLGQTTGLAIQTFNLAKADVDHSQDFSLVLTHIRRSDRVARGKASISVDGLLDGQKQTLELKELSPTGQEVLTFEFKHFKEIKGQLTIPENFQPEELLIKVWLDDESKKPHMKEFNWSELINR